MTLDARTVTLPELEARADAAIAAFEALPIEEQQHRKNVQFARFLLWLESEEVTGPKYEDIGALDEWRRQLAIGERTRTTFDTLWRAACLEAEARDLERLGCANGANAARWKAIDIIRHLEAR